MGRSRRDTSRDAADDPPPSKGAAGESPRLTRYELEIMDVVWRLGEATVQDVCDSLARPLAYTTVMTTLSLLEGRKRVLERTKRGRAYVYRPLITRDAVSRSILCDLKDVLFGGSVSSLVLNLVSDETLSPSDIATLRKALEDLEQGK